MLSYIYDFSSHTQVILLLDYKKKIEKDGSHFP